MSSFYAVSIFFKGWIFYLFRSFLYKTIQSSSISSVSSIVSLYFLFLLFLPNRSEDFYLEDFYLVFDFLGGVSFFGEFVFFFPLSFKSICASSFFVFLEVDFFVTVFFVIVVVSEMSSSWL